jgi:hypothetical protein
MCWGDCVVWNGVAAATECGGWLLRGGGWKWLAAGKSCSAWRQLAAWKGCSGWRELGTGTRCRRWRRLAAASCLGMQRRHEA